MNNKFLITIIYPSSSKTIVWDSLSPLPIGYPFNWIIEFCNKTLKIRTIPSLNKNSLSLKEKIIQGSDFNSLIELPQVSSTKVFIKIKKILKSSSLLLEDTLDKGEDLTVYQSVNSWIKTSELVTAEHTIKLERNKIFKITKMNNLFIIVSFINGLKVSRKKSLKLDKNEILSSSLDDLVNLNLEYNENRWEFRKVNLVELDFNKNPAKSKETIKFNKTLSYSTIGTFLTLFCGLLASYIIHTNSNEEFKSIPYTKIVMNNQSKEKDSNSTAKNKLDNKKFKSETNKIAAQNIRSRALRNSISGLLKGGMTKLLSESDFVTGQDATSLAKTVFNSSNQKTTKDIINLSSLSETTVASIGGSGFGEGNSLNSAEKGHTGYGHGEHAKVGNQGHSLISIDSLSAAVEDGLTKDEVGEVIHRHLSEIRYCYESAMIRTTEIEGKLIVNFTIGSFGEVKSSAIKSSTLSDPRLDDCILRRLVNWKFPKTKGGIDVAVTYPFIFKTIGRM